MLFFLVKQAEYSDVYPILMLHFIHHEGAFEGAEAVDGAEDVEDEFLVVLHVGGMDF